MRPHIVLPAHLEYLPARAITVHKLISLLWKFGLISIFLISMIGFWRALNNLPDTKTLLNAPTLLTVNGDAISMSAQPRWDHSKTVTVIPGARMKCANGYLVVPVEFVTKGMPAAGLKVMSIWLNQNGEWWSGSIDQQSARSDVNSMSLLAYGCASRLFMPLQSARVIARLAVDGHAGYLSAKPEKLEESF